MRDKPRIKRHRLEGTILGWKCEGFQGYWLGRTYVVRYGMTPKAAYASWKSA